MDIIDSAVVADPKNKNLLVALALNTVDAPALRRELTENRHQLDKYAEHIWTNLLIPLRSAGGQTPVPTPHPSRPDTPSAESEGELEELTNAESVSRAQTTLKKKLLLRDATRCLVTGLYDWGKNKGLGVPLSSTFAAHIIPFATHDKASFLHALHRFAPSLSLSHLIAGKNINQPYNGMTLTGDAHEAFSYFVFVIDPYLDEITGEQKYRIEVLRPSMLPHVLRRYEENSALPINGQCLLPAAAHGIAPPHPQLLQVHAALGRVLLASGRMDEWSNWSPDDDVSSPKLVIQQAIRRLEELVGEE